jgi:RNase P protein component
MPHHATPGSDFVVIARANTVHRRFDDLITDLESALRKLDVWVSEEPRAVEAESAQ